MAFGFKIPVKQIKEAAKGSPKATAEHQGRVPQPAIPAGPRNTAPISAPVSGLPAKNYRTPSTSTHQERAKVNRQLAALSLLNKPATFKPKVFQKKPTVGTPTLGSLRAAQQAGSLQTNKAGALTTPPVRNALKGLKTAQAIQGKANPNLSSPIVQTPEQQKIARLLVKVGKQMGANRKEKLAALTAGLQESGMKNLPISGPGGGWRQEESAFYKPSEITNPRKGAQNFYNEAKSTGRGKGESVAHLTQAIQGSGAGEFFYKDNVPEAKSLLRQANQRSLTSKQQAQIKQATADAQRLGIRAVPKKKHFKKATIAGNRRFAYPAPGWQNARTDMGKDYAYTHEGQPIRALSSATVVKTGAPGWPGEGGVLLKLDNSKGLPSPYVYNYEGIVPTVKAGQHVKKGQTIGTGGITGSIEIGYADSAGEPLSASEHSEVEGETQTKYGLAMSKLLSQVHKGKTRIPVSLVDAVHVSGSGGSPGYSVTAPTVAAYSQATGIPQKQVAQKLKAHKLSPQQIFRELARVGIKSPLTKSKPTTSQSKGSSELAELEAKYGSHAS